MQTKLNSYKTVEVETADRGRLLLMIYDHCIQWCVKAREAIRAGQIAKRTQAIFRVQDGITELICSLDMEKGGDIARNLRRLYEFYNFHLAEANIKNQEKNVADVQGMLERLREGWAGAIRNLSQNQELSGRLQSSRQKSCISMVG
ncbi:MAG TPA: flagellar export chaperone FliS [Fibrobacteraceae bacterium]|nr:flagellar export chaperone FliS [Fibrobacteraceae bacterium]